MLTTWDQRARRDKIKVTRINFPVPTTQDDLYQRFEKAITPQTKVLHFCHITNLTGQLFPVQRLSRLARQRGILTIVDGAHAVRALPVQAARSRVRLLRHEPAQVAAGAASTPASSTCAASASRKTWPLQAAPARQANDIRKFEEIGTHPRRAICAAINEALAFHQAIGVERKAARLRYLTMRWANR